MAYSQKDFDRDRAKLVDVKDYQERHKSTAERGCASWGLLSSILLASAIFVAVWLCL
jgi:hypothetical protein